MSAEGRLCTSQENPYYWVPTIKVRPPDGIFIREKKNTVHCVDLPTECKITATFNARSGQPTRKINLDPSSNMWDNVNKHEPRRRHASKIPSIFLKTMCPRIHLRCGKDVEEQLGEKEN
jgi:hypothetical protein